MVRSKTLAPILRTAWLVLIARPPLGEEMVSASRRQWKHLTMEPLTLDSNQFFQICVIASALALFAFIALIGGSYGIEIARDASAAMRLFLAAVNVVLGIAFFLLFGVLAIAFLGVALWREHNVSRASFLDFARYWLGEMLLVQALVVSGVFFLLSVSSVDRSLSTFISPLIGLVAIFGIVHLLYIVLLQPGLAWAHLLNKSRIRLIFTQFISILPVLLLLSIPDMLILMGVMEPLQPRTYPDVFRIPVE